MQRRAILTNSDLKDATIAGRIERPSAANWSTLLIQLGNFLALRDCTARSVLWHVILGDLPKISFVSCPRPCTCWDVSGMILTKIISPRPDSVAYGIACTKRGIVTREMAIVSGKAHRINGRSRLLEAAYR